MFTITIKELKPSTETEKYGRDETLYEQRVERLDVWAVIEAVNRTQFAPGTLIEIKEKR